MMSFLTVNFNIIINCTFELIFNKHLSCIFRRKEATLRLTSTCGINIYHVDKIVNLHRYQLLIDVINKIKV